MNRTITQLATLLRTFADELEGHCVAAVAAEAAAEPAAPKKRGRPAGTAGTPTPAANLPSNDPPTGLTALTVPELQAIIKPTVDLKEGKQIVALINKHGGTQLSTLPVENQQAFVDDVKVVERLLKLVEPIIKSGNGLAINTLVKEHGGTGVATIPAENRAAFEEAVALL